MKLVEVNSYAVSIFIAGSADKAESTCRAFCNQVGLCVTITRTVYVFSGGEEAGVIVGLINYPRFPKAPSEIWHLAEALASFLREHLSQQSYTIQAPDKTVWFSHRPEDAA